jgi:carbohydrate-selective porin OprB
MRSVLKTMFGSDAHGRWAVAWGALFVALMVGPTPAVAEAANGESWLARSRLSGHWGGARGELEARGVDLFAQYTAGFWSNVRGGFERGTRYEGCTTAASLRPN